MESKLEADTKQMFNKYQQLPQDAKDRVNKLMNNQGAYFDAVKHEYSKLQTNKPTQKPASTSYKPTYMDQLATVGSTAAAILFMGAYIL